MTRAAFKFYEEGDVIDHVVETNLLPHRGWTIPAGHPNYEVNNTYEIEEDIFLLSMGPHMHYRGKAMRYELEYPDGEREYCSGYPTMILTGNSCMSTKSQSSFPKAQKCT